ncbi:TIGR04255 family protein [Planctellipticum variicoloris]|uniref:TIGR04255 family protein n=1 Tax=Planctellipticum variicoloris TaxID=3064265 RepID=UPI0030138378|nr:TIGR04255 family protein [Planctomycetaceae bacterium SH412]
MSPLAVEPLPEYELPPVIEVVIGAQFAPIAGFLPTHLGLFWQEIRREYPAVEVAAPLAPVVERTNFRSATELSQVEVAAVPPLPRMFFIDATSTWLLQLQPDRFLQNWRRSSGDQQYPRFPAVRQRFLSSWSRLFEFCGHQELAPPEVNQLEVTYINHIEAGEGWQPAVGVSEVFRDFRWDSNARFLPVPEAIAWKASFALPRDHGRLHVSVRQAVRRTDDAPVLLCELTARGMPLDRQTEAIAAWIDLAREWIVRGFTDITTDVVQRKHWKRKA